MSPIDDIGSELDDVNTPENLGMPGFGVDLPGIGSKPISSIQTPIQPPPVIVDPIEQPPQQPQQPQQPQSVQQRQQFNPYNYLMQQFQSYMRPPQYSPFGYGGRSMYGLGSYGMSPMMGYGGYGGYGMSPMMGYGGGYGGGFNNSPFGGGLMSLFSGYMR